jgi:outer membrane protein assembly factor BamB
MSTRTLERTSRYLGTSPVTNPRNADYLLELTMHSSGIDVSGERAAYLFMSATAVLIDARSGREIWSFDVDGRNRLTPFLYGGDARVPTGAITAGVLNTVTVADFQRALEQLADFSSNAITDRLREALRDARDQQNGR